MELRDLKIPDLSFDIQILQHADDTTLPLADETSVKNAIEVVNMFSYVSGMTLNIDKTECILLSPLKDRYDKLHGVRMTNSAVKILGIYIGHDAAECNEKNWIQRIQRLEKLLDSWRKRYLTISGKVCIINSLALSKLYYCASILNFS